MPRIPFAMYTAIVSLSGFVLMVMQLLYLIKGNQRMLQLTFLCFLLFIVVFIICEIYLQSKFIGKG
jgi:heme/copper-type cytochrome/quinol oxidase subunit 3